MGPIGQVLPKVAWPVFGRTLLETQVRFARSLGRDEIWINLHHQAAEIRSLCEGLAAFRDVRWLEERPDILDIGGGIHNLASQPDVNYRGELLVLNADQFQWFTAQELEAWKRNVPDWQVLLLNREVGSDEGYNQVLSDDVRRFLRVVPNAQVPRGTRMETYTGNGLVDLAALKPTRGASAFFESICVPAERACRTARVTGGRYWDFGTASRYWSSMRGVLEVVARGDADPFIAFLLSTGTFDLALFDAAAMSYGTAAPGVINLGGKALPLGHPPGVVLSGPGARSGTTGTQLCYEGTIQAVD
jgi:hypothetical protein